jgi:putative hydrolase of the HAD superfamily
MKNASWIILVDFDDTQVPTAYRFAEADLQCALIITRSLRPHPPNPADIIATHSEIDSALVAAQGFAFARYVEGWMRTYEHFARAAHRQPESGAVEGIQAATDEIFRGQSVPFDGVPETLKALADAGHELHIISAGDLAHQRQKIAASGLEPLFRSVHVTLHDKGPVMSSIIGARRDRVMMVGDSPRSDIKPAIDLGIIAVHVAGDPWAYGNVPLDPRKYLCITSVSELPALIAALEAARK